MAIAHAAHYHGRQAGDLRQDAADPSWLGLLKPVGARWGLLGKPLGRYEAQQWG